MIWCSYRATGRSHMSNTITSRSPSHVRRIPPPQWRASGQSRGSERAHLAEQAYAAELAHAERVRAPAQRQVSPAGDTGASRSDEERGERRRWIALAVLCLGQLMIVLDATIVNVALPSIQRDLHFSQANLTWV